MAAQRAPIVFALGSGMGNACGMAPAPITAVMVVLAFAGASFFFSLAETSLFSLSQWQARQLGARDARRGGIVLRLLAQPQDLLAVMVFGNTVATGAMLATALWMGLQGRWPLAATIGGLVVVILIGCEVLPKTMAVRRPEQWALRVARLLQLVLTLSGPVCRLGQRICTVILRITASKTVTPSTTLTDGDYQELLEMAYQQGAIAQSEKETILQIISLDRRTVKEVMKPRSQMASISDDTPVEEMIAAARRHRHRRLPIYDETPDTIVGILNTHALLLDPQIDLADAIELPSFVPESMNLLQLLKSLQRQKRGLAIALDEFGGTAGIITLEDILGEVVGKIRGEVETGSLVMEKTGPGCWRLAGALRMDDFRREYPALGEAPEVETIGGLLMSLLDVVPNPGDCATFHGLKLTAKVTDERRVREVLAEVIKP